MLYASWVLEDCFPHEVTIATTLTRLLYAWRGMFLLQINKTIRMEHFPPNSPSFSDMVLAAEDCLGLLSAVTYIIFIFLFMFSYHYFPILSCCPGLLRRPHPFELPLKDDNNYIPRILYRLLLQCLHIPARLGADL